MSSLVSTAARSLAKRKLIAEARSMTSTCVHFCSTWIMSLLWMLQEKETKLGLYYFFKPTFFRQINSSTFIFSGLLIIPLILIAMQKFWKSMVIIELEFLLKEIFNLETSYFLTIVMDLLNNYDLWALNARWNFYKIRILIEEHF